MDDSSQFHENEVRLVHHILAFTRDGRLLSLQDLQMINEDMRENDLSFFHRVLYHYFIKRIVPYILSSATTGAHTNSSSANQSDASVEGASAKDGSEENEGGGLLHRRYGKELPLATAQYRALKLIEAGYLHFSELFDGSSPYGIFYFDNSALLPPLAATNTSNLMQDTPSSPNPANITTSTASAVASSEPTQKENFARLRSQVMNINDLYQRSLLEHSTTNFHSYIHYYKDHPSGKTLPSYQLCKHELVDCYGGEGDSDDDEEPSSELNQHHHHATTTAVLGKSGQMIDIREEDNDLYGSEDHDLDILLAKLRV